jgi:hypothetical protein
MMKWMLPLLFLLTSCLEDNSSPEAALKNFVEARMGTLVTRDYVLERVTGKMRQSLENITEEEFAKFADLRNVKKDSFKILSKSCQEKKCFVTYSVGYQTMEKDKPSFVTEVKKIAEIQSEEGKWLIAEVSNIKTYHEALEPINPLE